MKKILRLALITVLLLSLCLCLTGCNMIEDMRAAHGILQEDGAILLGGEEYIPLPLSSTLSPAFGEDYVYATAADVPVLLSAVLGDAHLLSKDGVFLLNDEDYSLESIYYCRSDNYDAVKAQIENGFIPVGYMYTYEVLTDPDTFETETKEYMLSTDEIQALEAVRADVIPAMAFSDIQSSYVAEIYLCSEDTYFKQYLCEIYYYDNGYLMVEYDENENSCLRKVPEAYNGVFAGIMEKAIESADSWDAYYSEW